jgi:hypothetical protein
MRVNEYSTDLSLRLAEDWPWQKWLDAITPANDKAAAGGTKEMQRYVAGFIREIMQLAGRYKDENDAPIKIGTLHQLPTRALYSYLRKMKLSDVEIANILKSLGKNKKLMGTVTTPLNLTTAQFNDDDATIGSIWKMKNGQPIDGKTAEMIIDKLIGIAAIRKMEIDEFGGDDQGNIKSQTYNQQTQPTTSPAPAAAAPAPTLSASSINATLQALGNMP